MTLEEIRDKILKEMMDECKTAPFVITRETYININAILDFYNNAKEREKETVSA